MQIQYAHTPKYLTADGLLVDLTVKFAEFNAEMPFAASPADIESHGRELFSRALAGEFGPIAAFPLPTLAQLKEAQWATIKAAREAAIDAPLVTPYGTVDSQAKDRTNITDAILLLQTLEAAGTPTTIDFTLADNTAVTLTTAQMVNIGLLLGQKVQAAHGQARARRAQIDAATTKAEVEAVVW